MGYYCEICKEEFEQTQATHSRRHQASVQVKDAEGNIVAVERETKDGHDGFRCPFCPQVKTPQWFSNAASFSKHVSRDHAAPESKKRTLGKQKEETKEAPIQDHVGTSSRSELREEDSNDEDDESSILDNSRYVCIFFL